jgi:hypothetical protein
MSDLIYFKDEITMERRGITGHEIERRLGELEHQRESGEIDWREYRSAKADLLALLAEPDILSFEEHRQRLHFQRDFNSRSESRDADFDRYRRRAA